MGRTNPASSVVTTPEETSEPKTLVADRLLERDRTEVSGPESRPEPVSAEPEPARRGIPPMLWAAAAALLLAVGGGVWWTSVRSGGQADVSNAAAAASGPTTPTDPPPAQEQPKTEQPAAAAPAAEELAHLPVMLADLRKLGYKERHVLLATDPGKVSVELHVGLGLVQAEESESPCRTFSDALTLIEGSERPRAFLWALREAKAPTGKTSACKQLGPRLQRLRALVETVAEAPKPTRHKKSRTRPRRNSPPTPAPATPTAPKPVADTPEPPPKKTGVAPKLDDDLRGL